MDKLLYGTAYYYEYLPYDRLHQDIQMMLDAQINVVRIAESTWSTMEPQPRDFRFAKTDYVLDAMQKAGISVIIGTPTYAIPAWMVKEAPDVMVMTKQGRLPYGARQIMDITHPAYLYYAERIIRKLISHVADRPNVIGFQIDNETKHYNTSAPRVQELFVQYLREKFNDDLELLNYEFGLDYWSNRIDSWEDFPDVRGTINGSLGAEFSKFQRRLVTRFLNWQAEIVNEYRHENQFVTQNFDFEWRGHSYGVQPDVDHFQAAKCLTIAGTDIYHPTQELLTGIEIAFGGDLIRSAKQNNYLVLETQAQGFPTWLPFRGQLRLQAFSHLASGADAVMYWHWHSIHNSAETYWKGLLSHDFSSNPTYEESKTIGTDFKRLSSKLIHLKKQNHVAVLISNEALTALNWFPVDIENAASRFSYNDIVRLFYDELYKLNIECDFITPDFEQLSVYQMIVVPALYAASENCIQRLKEYVKAGGHLMTSFKTAFANENLKVYHDQQPHLLTECLGFTYNQFTVPHHVTLTGCPYALGNEELQVSGYMELLLPTTAEVIAYYQHDSWKDYAAVTRNHFGKGTATHIGCGIGKKLLQCLLRETLTFAGLWNAEQGLSFPLITRKGVNQLNHTLRYFFNYSGDTQTFFYFGNDGQELLSEQPVRHGEQLTIGAWGILITEETESMHS